MINLYDIYTTKVKFKDKTGDKSIPVIVLGKTKSTVITAMIITHEAREKFEQEYVIEDWLQAGLNKPSTIRGTQRFEFPFKYLSNYVGRLTNRDINSLKKELKECLIESTDNTYESIKYSYDGPIFRFGQHWDFTDGKITTEAKSKKQAINNIVYRLKVQYGLDPNCNLSIYEPYLKEEPFTTKEYNDIMKELSKEHKPRKCPDCGTELNSLGDCPICDYFEYDLIED